MLKGKLRLHNIWHVSGLLGQCCIATEVPRITMPQKMLQRLERSWKKKASKRHQQHFLSRGPIIISSSDKSLNHHKGQTYSNFNPKHLASGKWKSRKSRGDCFTINATEGNPATKLGEECAQTFTDLDLNHKLLHALSDMAIKKPTLIQALAIPSILQGKNVLCAAETGSGKTLAYLLPMLEHLYRKEQVCHVRTEPNQPFGIVIVPSRELADQIFGVVQHLANYMPFHPHCVCGGRGTQKLLRNPEVNNMDILVTTPGVLKKMIANSYYNFSHLSHVILDEADTLLDDSFNALVLHILQKMKIQLEHAYIDGTGAGTQVALVGATLPRSLDKILDNILPMEAFEKITTPYLHRVMPHIPQKFMCVSEASKPETLLKLVKTKGTRLLPAVVFCKNFKTVCFVGMFLKENGVQSQVLHAEMPQKVREGLFQRFQNGECDVLVSTDIASRGLDTIRARCMINYDFPSFMSDYIHRVGRVGRVGSLCSSIAISLVAHKWEVDLLWKIESAVRMTTELHNVNANIKRKLRALWEQ